MDIQKVDDEIRRQWSLLDPDRGATQLKVLYSHKVRMAISSYQF
jgi:hypothetical protein